MAASQFAHLFATTTAQNPPPYYNKPAGVDAATGMHYMRLGQTGAVVSRICLGLMSYTDETPMFPWMLNAEQGEQFVSQALKAGINFFDTAEMYHDGGSERFFGAALKKVLPTSRYTRDDIFITSKIMPLRSLKQEGGPLQRGLSRKAIYSGVEGALERLQLDYLDLYLLHRYDASTDPEETMKALHDLVVAGKIRYIGTSAMYLWQFARLNEAAERNGWTKLSVMQVSPHYSRMHQTRSRCGVLSALWMPNLTLSRLVLFFFCLTQNHYNALYREEEREMIPYCIDHGITLTPYSPLATGLLTRQPTDEATTRSQTDPMQKRRYTHPKDVEVIGAVQAVAKARDLPPAQIALAWLLSKPGVCAPVIGATKPHHIEDAVKSLGVQLSADEVKQIEDGYEPHAVAGHT